MWRAPEGPEGTQGLAAVPVGGGGAWPGFEIDHSERSSRVAISRAAGPDGARNTSGAARNNNPGTPKGRVPQYPPLVGSLSHCLVEAQAE